MSCGLRHLNSFAQQCCRPLGALPSCTRVLKVTVMSSSPGRSLAAAVHSGKVAALSPPEQGDLGLAEPALPLQQIEQQKQQQEHQEQQRQQPAQQPRTRPTQGELVQRCMVAGPPTIDIGANLVDRSFDKVGLAWQACMRGHPRLVVCSAEGLHPCADCVGLCSRGTSHQVRISPALMQDREAVLERAAQAGVAAIIVTGTCVRTSRAAAALCDSPAGRRHNLHFTAGVHCHNAKVGRL